MMRYGLISALLILVSSRTCLAQKKVEAKPVEENLSKIVERNFARWDRDHNNVLDLLEVDHVIEDHNVHGRQSGLAVRLRRYMADDKNGNPSSLSHEHLIKLVDEPAFTKSVNQLVAYLEKIDRELFIHDDPELSTFGQGKLNDCYLLAAIAAQTNRSPKSVRQMIHPEVTGGFQVFFGDGEKIQVSPLTEGELLLGAKLDDRHGSWLVVIEKAYGVIRKRERARKGEKATVKTGNSVFEILNWGDSGVTIGLLTGHHTESLSLGKASQLEQVHNLLSDLTRKRRLICAGKGKDQCPPGIVANHAYAILGYHSKERVVTVFNPWGNTFTPKGTSCVEHGYLTKNGHFSVPLQEFHTVFSDLVYETDKPLTK